MGKTKVARRAKPVDFISHSPNLIGGMRFSSQEFYARLERALQEREVPDLQVTRVIWKEGGVLSPGREYLRVQRERYVFDVCAAPFGTSFFVSVWCAERPFRLGLVAWLAVLITLLMVTVGFLQYQAHIHEYLLRTFKMDWDGAVTAGLFALGFIYLVAAVVIGSHLDMFMMGIPVLGYFYERYFRAITYYRIDMMTMYRTVVTKAVEELISEISKAQGIAPASEFNEKPIMRKLLEPTHG